MSTNSGSTTHWSQWPGMPFQYTSICRRNSTGLTSTPLYIPGTWQAPTRGEYWVLAPVADSWWLDNLAWISTGLKLGPISIENLLLIRSRAANCQDWNMPRRGMADLRLFRPVENANTWGVNCVCSLVLLQHGILDLRRLRSWANATFELWQLSWQWRKGIY